jgi:hypothetical protein
MEKDSILKISGKKIHEKDISEIKKFLENKYEISYGDYSPKELRKAISGHSPFFIQDHFIIGYEDKHFISDKKERIEIGRMVKAVIIEDETEGFSEDEDISRPDPACDKRDFFIIQGRNEWEGDYDLKAQSIFGNLRVGDLFLPPHSVIINFLAQTDELKKKKIVSMLSGDNINIYSQENFIDNIMHEIGHVFWRDCLKPDEQARFKEYFKFLRVSGIFEYEWERSAPEEFFCTVYKWYLKSLLLNKSFRNILEYEEPEGLRMLEEIFDRLRRDKIAAATWSISGKELFDYLNPKLDITTGKRIVKKGTFDSIRDLSIPEQVQAENMERYERGRRMIRFGKAVVPVLNNRIDWQEMEEMRKARMTKYVKKIPKAGGGWRYIYEEDVKKKSSQSEVKQTETAEFKKWFSNSKVVDKEGKPLVVYHGTNQEFKEFDLDKTGSNNDPGMWGKGFYFSPDKKVSKTYGEKIIPVYLSIKNPFIVRQASSLPKELKPVTNTEKALELRNRLIEMGYDGAIHYETGEKKRLYQIVAFSPAQIKSATNN